MKRTSGTMSEDITREFTKRCKTEFNSDPINILARNTVINTGSLLASTDSNETRKVSHIFLNSIKKKDTKATNQGSSGRCWMFSGLNVFRHNVIEAMGINNFEFSETYLFFWDKFERSNSFLQFFVESQEKSGSQLTSHILQTYMTDGGFWNTFSNLVEKYGVVPKDAMPETATSGYSEEMNNTLLLRLRASAALLSNSRKLSYEKRMKIKEDTMKRVYNILVKCLGEPPETFTWFFNRETEFNEDSATAIPHLTPKMFREMTIPINTNDFVVLTDMPCLGYYKKFEINHTDNVLGLSKFKFLNVPNKILKKYAMKSLLKKMPVWFGADVNVGFNPIEATLDDKLVDDTLLFGDIGSTFTKSDKLKFFSLQGNHAMTLTGVNINENDLPESWQVENSWSYYDNETPGEDGFLYMSDSWFTNNMCEIAIHKAFLPKKLVDLLDGPSKILEPYECVAPALKIRPMSRPMNYLGMDKKSKK